MTHFMKLAPKPFFSMAEGKKTIELRIKDEKRQKIAVGDTIIFRLADNCDIITATVKELHSFPDFRSLYKNLPLDKCGYSEKEIFTADPSEMERYYQKEQIEKYGALGIELSDIFTVCDVKDRITWPSFFKLLAPSVFNPTTERLSKRADGYKQNDNAKVFAYCENCAYKGIVVFEIKENKATVLDIAVIPEEQGMGIGKKLIDFIFCFDIDEIVAETDDDAIGFYKKCGFTVTETRIKYDTQRYVLVKHKGGLL